MFNVVKGLAAAAAASVLYLGISCAAAADKTAVVYFSKAENSAGTDTTDALSSASVVKGRSETGSTAYIAELIADRVKGELFSIKTVKPYPASFDETIRQNHYEQQHGIFPAVTNVPDLSAYSVVYLGYPVWNMRPPQPIYSFLERSDLKKKRIVLFCTHDGYGAGRSFSDLKAILSSSQVDYRGLEVASDSLDEAEQQVDDFLHIEKSAAAVTASDNIVVQVAGRNLHIRLNGSMEARQFKALLPLTVRMGEFGGREYYGPVSQVLKVNSPGQLSFEDGTLTYCPTNNTVAIFYAQSARPRLTMEIFPLGKVTDDLSVFGHLGGTETFEFRAKE